jgi:hypothetical protein
MPNVSVRVGAILHAGFGSLHCGSRSLHFTSWLDEHEHRKHGADEKQEYGINHF